MAAQNVWVPWGTGGAMASPYLSKRLYQEALGWLKFDQLCETVGEFGPGKGDAYYYRVEQDLTGSTSFAGNVLNELSPIPLDAWSHVRTSISVSEIGRGASYTKKSQILNSWNMDERTRDKLRRHLTRTLENGAATAFKSTDVKFTPTSPAAGSFSLTGTAAADATATLTAFHIRDMVDYLEGTLKAEPYDDDGSFVLVVGVKGRRALFDDLEIEKAYLEAYPERRLNGEIGRYYRCRIVTVNTGDLGVVGTASCPEAILTGRPSVLKPVVQAPILLAQERDFGRFIDIAWWGLLGYGIALDYSTTGMASVIHVTST